jgi:hypothetical protein
VTRQLRSTVLYVVLAAASFLLTSSFVRTLVPWPEGLGLQAKLEYFEAHRDEFDALYIGSSRVIRGLDNRRVDAYLAAEGIEMRSFNLAVGGMRVFEQDFLLHAVLAMEPARLRWVFIEGGPVGLGLREDHVFRAPPNLWSARGVHWHSPAETLMVLRAIRRLPVSTWRKLALASTHLQLLGWRTANYGKGEEILERFRANPRRARRRAEALAEIRAGGGHQGLEDATGRETSDELEAFLVDPTPFEERIAAIAAENALPVPLEEVETALHRRQLAAAAAHGVRLVYFVPPGYEGSPERRALHAAGVIPALFDFNDPARYPELFRLDHRFDKGHLNRRGVERFSALFAEAVRDLVRQEADAQ